MFDRSMNLANTQIAPPGNKSKSQSSSLYNPSWFEKIFPDKKKSSKPAATTQHPPTNSPIIANWDSKTAQPKAEVPPLLIGISDEPEETDLTNLVVNDVANRMATSGAKSSGDSANMMHCKHCKKPISKLTAPDHVQDCLRKKQEKLQKKKEAKEAKDAALRKERNGGISPEPSVDENGNKKSLTSAKKTANMGDGLTGSKKTGKKRKADDEAAGPSKKKKKDDGKQAKTAKPKGPVDVEKQCGVVLPNGSMCARSLTCKSHSMGAKRAVPGRSMPYDVLLAQYQKKSHARQHRKFNNPARLSNANFL
jgi:SAGA-associated factor 73